MGLIDSHAHLTDKHLCDDIDGILERANAASVDEIISIASDVADTARAIELAERYASIHATAGIHPHEAAKVEKGDWPRLAELLKDPSVVACGELGLDYHYDFADRATQHDVFTRQLVLNQEAKLPLVIHCREAFDDVIGLLVEHGYQDKPVVVHCFSGTEAEAESVAKHGWRLSFTGLVTFKSATTVQEVARTYPADKIIVETDSPYLSPIPVRKQFPNEPANVAHTAKFLAELRGEDYQEFVDQTAANTREFFELPG